MENYTVAGIDFKGSARDEDLFGSSDGDAFYGNGGVERQGRRQRRRTAPARRYRYRHRHRAPELRRRHGLARHRLRRRPGLPAVPVRLQPHAAAFIGSDEFVAMCGAKPGNGDFLKKIYRNILHRASDQAGFDYWLGAMNAGTGATDILAQFSQSRENIVALAGAIENGIAYTPFI